MELSSVLIIHVELLPTLKSRVLFYLCGVRTPCLLLTDWASSGAVIGPAGPEVGNTSVSACWMYESASVCEEAVEPCSAWSHAPGQVEAVCVCGGMEWRQKQGRRCLCALY